MSDELGMALFLSYLTFGGLFAYANPSSIFTWLWVLSLAIGPFLACIWE